MTEPRYAIYWAPDRDDRLVFFGDDDYRGYRALLAVGVFDGQRGYLVEIYLDSDHTDLAALAPHARVLAHYCVRTVSGRRNGTRGA